ncbi:NAD(+)/NADH kinase [Helicobacter sp. 23-1044]
MSDFKNLRKIGVLLRPKTPSLKSAYDEFVAVAGAFGIDVILEKNSAEMISAEVAFDFDEMCEKCDILASIGGDGTLISLMRKSFWFDKPIFGVNMGRLGFLTSIKIDELSAFLQNLKNGECDLRAHLMLGGEILENVENLENLEILETPHTASLTDSANRTKNAESQNLKIDSSLVTLAQNDKKIVESVLLRHCEARSAEAIQKNNNMDGCFASLANSANCHDFATQNLAMTENKRARFCDSHKNKESNTQNTHPLAPSAREGEQITDSAPNPQSAQSTKILRCVNEFLITKQNISGMICIKAHIDGRYFNTYRCDGLIIGTPTGSSAYNISAGGSIVYPYNRNILLTPICAHSLTQKPLVLSDEFALEFSIIEGSAKIIIDGQEVFDFPRGASFRVKVLQKNSHLIYGKNRDYFAILREKFGWGD